MERDLRRAGVRRPPSAIPFLLLFPSRHSMTKTSLDKSKIKFLLLEGVHPSALDVLRGAG